MSSNTHETREGWLKAAASAIEDQLLKPHGMSMPEKVAYSCGFPKGHARAIGQCWHPSVTPDGTHHIFICPTLTSSVEVLATLLHEQLHSVVGCEHGHKKPFRDAIKKVGLAGKATATFAAPETPLHDALTLLGEALGPYPHSGMRKPVRKKGQGGGGWIRLRSPQDNDYTLVISPKSVDRCGLPQDPWGNEMEPVE